jgi:hypothetical protein
MDLILSSFGVSHRPRRERRNTDIFYRMPPVALATAGQDFMPDYAVLLLADRIVIDRKTYDLLLSGRHYTYGNVALMTKMLFDEGFVRLEDFDSVVAQNRGLLERMLERDLKELDSWVAPLKESVQEWRSFVDSFRGPLRHDFLEGRLKDQDATSDDQEFYQEISYRMSGWLHGLKNYSLEVHYLVEAALESSRKRRESEHREALRDVLREYLSYVNANLLLANELDGSLYDWSDFRPFYRDKFLRIGRDTAPGQEDVDNIRKLFQISFPEFAFWTPANVIRALKDRRIVELRRLVEAAAEGRVEFDREFGVRVLTEVLGVERSIGKLRNFVSYATLPLGLIPWVGDVVQKVVEEAVVQPIARKRKSNYRWFYLISEMAERPPLLPSQTENPD